MLWWDFVLSMVKRIFFFYGGSSYPNLPYMLNNSWKKVPICTRFSNFYYFFVLHFLPVELPLHSIPLMLEDTHNSGPHQQVGLHCRQVLRSCLRIVCSMPAVTHFCSINCIYILSQKKECYHWIPLSSTITSQNFEAIFKMIRMWNWHISLVHFTVFLKLYTNTMQ